MIINKILKEFNGVLVAPGFGERGVEGKIKAIEYVRKNKIPFFGICYGMQMASIISISTTIYFASTISKRVRVRFTNSSYFYG